MSHLVLSRIALSIYLLLRVQVHGFVALQYYVDINILARTQLFYQLDYSFGLGAGHTPHGGLVANIVHLAR